MCTDSLYFVPDYGYMLTRTSNIEHDAKTRQLLGHGYEGILTISAEMDTIEVSSKCAIKIVDKIALQVGSR